MKFVVILAFNIVCYKVNGNLEIYWDIINGKSTTIQSIDAGDACKSKGIEDIKEQLAELKSKHEKDVRQLENQIARNVKDSPNTFIDCNGQEFNNTNSRALVDRSFDLPITQVYCDDGWTTFQRRVDGLVDFYRTFAEYEEMFGSAEGEYWLGLKQIHEMTKNGDYKLRVKLEDMEGNRREAHYSSFVVGPKSGNYVLQVSGYSGDAGDSLDYHNRQQFSAKDVDNDNDSGRQCSTLYMGAWWYGACYHSNLNGLYTATDHMGIRWNNWKLKSLKGSMMQIKKRE